MSDSSKQVTVTEDGVEVQRTIEDRSTATVVVYRLRTVASTPAVAHVAESIPPQDRVETLEFHPKHSPNDWTKGDGTVQFDVIVPSNRTRMVVLGLEAAGEEPLGRDEPTVSRSELSMDDLRDADSAESVTAGFDADAPEADGSSVLDHDIEPVADGGDTSADSASDEVLDLPDPNADDDETDDDAAGDEVLDSPDRNADDDETDGDDAGDEVLDPPDPSEGPTVDAVGEDEGPDGEEPDHPDANDSDHPDVEGSATPGAEPSPDIDGDAEAPGGEHGDDDPAEPIVSDDADGDGLTLDGDAVDDLRLDDGTADDRTLEDGTADDRTLDDGTADDRTLDDGAADDRTPDDDGSAATTDDDSLLGDLLAEIRSATPARRSSTPCGPNSASPARTRSGSSTSSRG
ncbi:hypothetical protein [Halolamina rubra]|uniref:hypothetical protein n=1 Tax=Halolamina rubra TaxID=1380430 RepID=UPI000679B695|nr:hypothetical protein [Halolamina rubra]